LGYTKYCDILDMKMERLHRGKPILIMTIISLGWFDK